MTAHKIPWLLANFSCSMTFPWLFLTIFIFQFFQSPWEPWEWSPEAQNACHLSKLAPDPRLARSLSVCAGLVPSGQAAGWETRTLTVCIRAPAGFAPFWTTRVYPAYNYMSFLPSVNLDIFAQLNVHASSPMWPFRVDKSNIVFLFYL